MFFLPWKFYFVLSASMIVTKEVVLWAYVVQSKWNSIAESTKMQHQSAPIVLWWIAFSPYPMHNSPFTKDERVVVPYMLLPENNIDISKSCLVMLASWSNCGVFFFFFFFVYFNSMWSSLYSTLFLKFIYLFIFYSNRDNIFRLKLLWFLDQVSCAKKIFFTVALINMCIAHLKCVWHDETY